MCVYNIKMKPWTINNGINAIKEVRELFNDVRSNLSLEETKRIREKLYKKEAIHNFLKEKEKEDSLTNKEKKVLKNIDRYIKNFKKRFREVTKISI